MAKSMFEDAKKELYSIANYGDTIHKLRVNAFNKLKEFCERAGKKFISELNTLIDNIELNEYIRMAFNDEDPTLDNRNQIRPADFLIQKMNTVKNL